MHSSMPSAIYFTVFSGGKIFMLDLAAKIDQTAEYLCKAKWGDIEFPPPFGREALPEVSVNNLTFKSSLIHSTFCTCKYL